MRQVFAWYVEGKESGKPLNLRAIAKKLHGAPTYADRHGAPKKRAQGGWSASVVFVLLKNETLCGVWHYGRHSPVEHVLSVEVPAIADRAQWEAAQEPLRINSENSRRNRKPE